MNSLTLQLQHEFRHINKARTLSLLGFVLLLMISPLFASSSQQPQEIRQRAQVAQTAPIVASEAAIPATEAAIASNPAKALAELSEPYYPEISPWVFIIPGIIILIVILFN